jgi:hypothetical protein
MKNIIIVITLSLFCISCERNGFDIENPDVARFVQQIKNGTYDNYELGENGQKLWTKMPHFKTKHIPTLLNLANDTMSVCPCDHFPLNPISSIPPYRINNGKECIMIGEYLLWCVEGIIEGNTFASLTPIIQSQNKEVGVRLNGMEVLHVRTLYQNWWQTHGEVGNNDLPLEGTIYYWR